MANRLGVFFWVLMFSIQAFGQTEAELLMELSNTTNDSARFFLQRELGFRYEFSDSAMAMKYYTANFPLAKKLGSRRMMSMVWVDCGRVEYNYKHYDKARENYYKSLKEAESVGDHQRAGVAYTNIGNSFIAEYRYDLAALYLFRAIGEQEKSRDSVNLALSYSTLGVLYEDAGKFDNALFYLNKCKEISLKNINYQSFISASITEGIIHRKKGNNELMFSCINEAIEIIPKYDQPFLKASFYQNISGLFFDAGYFEKANQYADSSLKYHEINAPGEVNAAAYMSKGLALLKLKDNQKGKRYLQEALNTAISEKDYQVAREIHLELAEIAAREGDWKTAYINHTRFVEYKDSTYSEQLTRNAAELSVKFQTEKQQLTLQKLAEENKLNLLIANHEKRKGYFILAAGSLLLLVLVLLFIIQRRKTLFIRKEAELQQEQIKRLESEKKLIVLDSMLKGEENERSRVAKDLHDGVGSMLSGVKLSLASMQGNMIIREDQAYLFEKSLRQLDEAIAEMRRVAHNMMPALLHHSGLLEATGMLVKSLSESSKKTIHFEHNNFPENLSNEYRVILYRLIQELLNNAIKHSEATAIIVQLNGHENHLSLVVEDNGKGFDINLWEHSTGMGFHNLKNRVEYLNGKINVNSNPKEGSSFLIEFTLIND